MSDKKPVWSLQNSIRTEEERNVFKPTGKKPKDKLVSYIFSTILVVLVSSFALTFLQTKQAEICFTSNFCFNSKDDILLYTIYVFLNIIIVVLAILAAYLIGRKLGNIIKR
ncbi:MAG: hypothetical protein HKO92_01210 [Flavobacteriaceae bacterium]|nr:hypothetical protein [Bacteroidia bacterium]NNK81717.1 hypothetical protein [Flavobacteriaceae bacterium]